MRIRVKDLIEELQRFPPDDVVEFEFPIERREETAIGWKTVIDKAPLEYDRADQRGFEVKIQLAQP